MEPKLMLRRMLGHTLRIAPLLAGALFFMTGCQEGPAERAGERVDNAAREVRDTVNPPQGPVEAAGRKIDDATGNP
jgi:formylmethanofuran:tetrahydromethanopterin formyltransferase